MKLDERSSARKKTIHKELSTDHGLIYFDKSKSPVKLQIKCRLRYDGMVINSLFNARNEIAHALFELQNHWKKGIGHLQNNPYIRCEYIAKKMIMLSNMLSVEVKCEGEGVVWYSEFK